MEAPPSTYLPHPPVKWSLGDGAQMDACDWTLGPQSTARWHSAGSVRPVSHSAGLTRRRFSWGLWVLTVRVSPRWAAAGLAPQCLRCYHLLCFPRSPPDPRVNR